jgi:hypothetical protein
MSRKKNPLPHRSVLSCAGICKKKSIGILKFVFEASSDIMIVCPVSKSRHSTTSKDDAARTASYFSLNKATHRTQ